MENITGYSDDELSKRVFADEYLRSIRNTNFLHATLVEQYRFNYEQLTTLRIDIKEDNNENT